MKQFQTLETYLLSVLADDSVQSAVTATILGIATAAIRIRNLVALGPLTEGLDAVRDDIRGRDDQERLHLVANEYIIEALQNAPVALLVSEALDKHMLLHEAAPLSVAIAPLDDSSSIPTHSAVGTIFSILRAAGPENSRTEEDVLQAGVNQLAAGYCIYGPQTSLVLTVGAGTHVFTLDPLQGEFRLTVPNVQIAETTREFAINVSNYRHWDRHVRAYIDDCLDGENGPRKSNYDMRWVASLVAGCHRILSRGGILLYPGDASKTCAQGRLGLLYECNPIAFLIEQAGGGATTGLQRVLEIKPDTVHQRAPMIFGSNHEIRRVERYYAERDLHGERSQLFNRRGLFRA